MELSRNYDKYLHSVLTQCVHKSCEKFYLRNQFKIKVWAGTLSKFIVCTFEGFKIFKKFNNIFCSL